MARRPKVQVRSAAELRAAHGKILQATGVAHRQLKMLKQLNAGQGQKTGGLVTTKKARGAGKPRLAGIRMGGD